MANVKDKIVKLFLKSKIIRNFVIKVFDKVNYVDNNLFKEKKNIENSSDKNLIEEDIAESYRINCRKSHLNIKRINLLIPALALKYVFGGISTAISFFNEIRKGFDNARIILTEESNFTHDSNPNFSEWNLLSMDSEDECGLVIVSCGDSSNRTLSVSENDRFIATAWWTAINASRINKWQNESFDNDKKNKFIYLIQDYEPGFYPWSSRYAMAESTYQNPENFIAVFNTNFLYDFFRSEGYTFYDYFIFDPILNSELKKMRDISMQKKREKQILVYGRPGVERNCFQIIIMTLKLLISKRDITGWKFLSAGEYHEPVYLGNGNILNSLGKLSLEEYANILGNSAIGISLMVSPHPSYPPLEMAAFGMKVITNKYHSKDLSVLSDNIYSLDSLFPEVVEDVLFKIMQDIDKTDFSVICKNKMMSDYINCNNVFEGISIDIYKNLYENGKDKT